MNLSNGIVLSSERSHSVKSNPSLGIDSTPVPDLERFLFGWSHSDHLASLPIGSCVCFIRIEDSSNDSFCQYDKRNQKKVSSGAN